MRCRMCGRSPEGIRQAENGVCRASREGGKTSLMSLLTRLLNDAMSHIRNCPVENVSREWWVG